MEPEPSKFQETGSVELRTKKRRFWASARLWSFTLSLSFVQLLNLFILTYFSANVNTVEKQFGFSSARAGLIMSSEDVAYVLLVLIVTYLGEKGHKPRILGASSFCFSVSGFMCLLPYLIYGHVEVAAGGGPVDGPTSSIPGQSSGNVSSSASLCLPGDRGEFSASGGELEKRSMFQAVEFNSVAFALFVIGFLLTGAASTPISSLGLTYIDDNVKRTRSAFFMGIVSSVRVLGPVVGFSLGAVFSKIPVDFRDRDYGVRDPRWVGAWWLGFSVISVAGVIFGIPLMFFPKYLNGKPAANENTKAENDAEKTVVTKESAPDQTDPGQKQPDRPRRALLLTRDNAKELPRVMLRLMKNPVYACLAISSCLDSLMIGGYYSFLSKYLRIHHNVPFWKAGLVAGWCGAAASSFGCFLGGFITSKWRMTPLMAAKFATVAAILSALLHGVLTGVSCDQNPIVGLTKIDNSTRMQRISTCSADCACPEGEFLPVCGDNDLSYVSPCSAGCRDSYVSNTTSRSKWQTKSYMNCKCVDRPMGVHVVDHDGSPARVGVCEGECDLTTYAIILLASSILLGLFSMPLCIITLRCVCETDRSMALGLGAFLANIFGFLPAPIVTGTIVDSTCLLWSGVSGKGACSVYDKPRLRIYFHVLITCYKVVGCLFKVAVMVMYATGHVTQPDMQHDKTAKDLTAQKKKPSEEIG